MSENLENTKAEQLKHQNPELLSMEEISRLELGPEKIEDIIKHIDDAIEKLNNNPDVDKEEMINDLKETKRKAEELLSSFKTKTGKQSPETIH